MFAKDKKLIRKFDFVLSITTIILVVFGLFMINSTTASFADTSEYISTQLIAFLLGICAVIVLVLIDYEVYGLLYIPIYICSNLLLVAVLIWGFGAEEWGADNWLSVFGVTFQPSELAKFGIIISLAKFIEINHSKLNEPLTLLKILIFAFLPVALIALQPDYGTSLVFVFFIVIMIFAAGLDYKYIIPFVVIFLVILIAGILFFTFGLEDYDINDPDEANYIINRILVFLNPELDTSGSGYQVLQSKIAIGSGQMFGRGYKQGVQNQYEFLPTKETDFVFSIICEEFGFVGGATVIFLYTIMLFRFVKISKNANNIFGSLIVIGIMGMFLFHILQNIGMTMGMLPVTGIPLPFLSYGGTFMLLNMISIGLVLGIGLRPGKIDKYN